MTERIRIVDVAEAAGVSHATVSLALNGRAAEYKISETTAQNVKATAHRLGYRPDFHSRAIRGKTRTMGFFAQSGPGRSYIDSTMFAEFLSGVNSAMIKRGMMLSIVAPPCPGLPQGNDSVLLTERCLDGAIVFFGLEDQTRTLYDSLQLPTVWLDADQRSSHNCVYRDEVESYRLGTEYLQELGHRHIVGLMPVRDSQGHASDPLAAQGYREGMEAGGLPSRIVPFHASNPDHVHTVQEALKLHPRPTAFVSPCAEHTCYALLKLGFKVPEEFSVVSFGYRHAFQTLMPGVSEVTFDRNLMGQNAAEMLCRLCESGEDQPSYVYRSRIIPRDTTRRIGGSLLSGKRRNVVLERVTQ